MAPAAAAAETESLSARATSGIRPSRPGRGLVLAAACYGMFSLQDATVKWLVEDYSVFQVLFMRSLVVLVLASLVGGRPAMASLRQSRNKVALALRAALILAAWFMFFTAARRLGLAELTTIYFAAPVITVCLSVIILKEKVRGGRWLAVAAGFVGVVIAAKPGGGVTLWPAVLTLGAASVWALSGVLARLISRSEGTATQMIASNALFVFACAVALPWVWRTPHGFAFGLMIATGLAGGLGQVLMYEAFRLAPASLVAPTEYTAFIWAFLLGFAIWGDVPTIQVWMGAALIVGGGVLLLWSEWGRLRGSRRSKRMRGREREADG